MAFLLAAGMAEAWLDASYPYRRLMSYSSDFQSTIPYVLNGTCGMWAIGNNTAWYSKVSGELCTDSTDFKISDNADTAQANMTNETHAAVGSYGNLWDGMSSLSARWDFNNNVLDSTSNNNDGTNTGADYTASGKFGGAMDFELDNTDYIYAADADSLDLGTGQFTISAWIKLESVSAFQWIAAKDNGNAETDFLFGVKSTGELWALTANNVPNIVTSTATLSTATWYHVALTQNATHLTLYIDGDFEAAATYSGGNTNGYNLIIGARTYATPANHFDGIIDELRIYKRALSPAEMAAEYASATVNTLEAEETESSDDPPSVNISAPQNATYYITSIDFNFTVSDGEDATFHVVAYNDTDAIYDNAAYANNTALSFTLTETGGQQNVTVWANDSAGNEVTSDVLYYVWMGLNVSAYNNATNASMTDWAIIATNGTFTYTNDSQNNPSLIEWSLLPQGTVNITIDDNSTTLYFYNATYERTLNNSALVQLDAFLQPKSDNPVSLSSSGGWSMLQGQSTTITCTAEETTAELSVNSVLVSSPYILTVQTGQYAIACNAYNETENYAPTNSSNILLVNPLISCTSNETFAYYATITTATNLTTLDFTSFASQNIVRDSLGDVYVPLANDTWINTTGGNYVVVNNTGSTSFTVYFGNYYANKSYNTSSLEGDQKNITTYTQINPSIIYNILDELTGEYMFPPNATLTSIIHCSLGETYIQIDEGDTQILLASSTYLDKASLRILYTADAYYSRQIYPAESDALALSFYVVDALQNALDRIDFLMEDINYYDSKLQVYKIVQNETLIITEGYFDASHYFSVYLMEDSDYYMRTVGSTGTLTDFGRITIVAPSTKVLGQVTMNLNPQATLIADNIFMNAWTDDNRTALYVVYTDSTNETNNVTVTVYFGNGTVFDNATYFTQSVNVEHNISAYTNESFTVEFSLWHETFGNSPVSYAIGVFPGVIWDLGIDSRLYTLYSLVLLMLIGGVATRRSIVAGSALFMLTMLMLYHIGWLSVPLVSIVFIGVLLLLGVIISQKEEGIS